MDIDEELCEAYQAEGWEYDENVVYAFGMSFEHRHPISIALKVYRESLDPLVKLSAMTRAFMLLWPEYGPTYNYWMDDMFREHCNVESRSITFCGGGGIGKTEAAAFIATIFWLSDPARNTVLVASTTLEALKSRIYGYIKRNLEGMSIPFEFSSKESPSPKISLPNRDNIHGIFGFAAHRDDDQEAIKNLKGRHPKGKMLIVLDEATDMPPAIMGALPNLKKGLEGPGEFQLIAIGNSNSTTDLHGALSTPLVGWDNIDPFVDKRWETTHPNGVALYFNPYNSPAIHESDPVKKRLLSKFLMTEAKLLKAEQEEGKDSVGFWMFTMGFWKSSASDKTILSEAFLKDYDCRETTKFNSVDKVDIIAALDPAFSVGGDKCILRLALLGWNVAGKRVLDFRGNELVFEIKLMANTGLSAELQIADKVIEILDKYGVPLGTLCIDASGAGRGLADVIALRSGGRGTPTKIYSTNVKKGGLVSKDDFGSLITSGHEMWYTGRQLIAEGQLFGLDALAYGQLHTRRYVEKNGKKELEKKIDYKRRMAAVSSLLGRSPDEADAAMLVIQAAIHHHGFGVGQMKPVQTYNHDWEYAYHQRKKEYIESLQPVVRYSFKPSFSSSIQKYRGTGFR